MIKCRAGDSNIASGSLLYKVVYPDPDSSETDKRVLHAYNAQGQVIWTKDQAGNIIETDYDDSGKLTHRRATTIVTADGFDDLVKRISTTYDSLGRVSLVTQYDNATVGSGSVLNEIKNSYELAGWGSLTKHQFDRDSAVGGSGYYEVSYTYEKATTGRNTIRRTTQTLPDGNVITFEYRSGIDADSSRVSYVKDGGTTLASYEYNGVGHVVGVDLAEADVMWKMHGASSSSFPDLDQFNRVTSNRWTKDLATDVDFFDLDITYDRNSNITLVEDNIYGGVDVAYTIDSLSRLVKAKEGTWNGSSITSMTREQLWQDSGGANMLDQLGNWEQARLDLNGNGNFGDTVGAVVEYDDDRTHNMVNELTGRDTDDNGTDNYTLVYDKVGNLTDDGQSYTYVYDAFGRLRKIKNRSNGALVEEFWYDGSNRRVAWKSDSEPDGDVDASDKTYYVKHDERWRIVGVFRESDTSAKEAFVYHNAGASGYGGSSYIDDCILRDRDHNSGWTSAADGTLEQRRYYCQNWRHDVVALIKSDGKIAERDRYLSYGTPFGSPLADATFDGTVNASDTTQVNNDWGANYHVRSDFNLDGAVGAADSAEVTANSGKTLGWGTLSDMTNVASRKGYAGYEIDIAIAKLYHVRYRVLSTELGRWLRRDPMGDSDGPNRLQLCRSNPRSFNDPLALCTSCSHGSIAPHCDTGEGRQVENPQNSCDFCCTTACDKRPGANGLTACCGADATACVCAVNMRRGYLTEGLDCFWTQYEMCVLGHEKHHRCVIDCSNNTTILYPPHLPWIGVCDDSCSECDAYTWEKECVSRIVCSQCENETMCHTYRAKALASITKNITDKCNECWSCWGQCGFDSQVSCDQPQPLPLIE